MKKHPNDDEEKLFPYRCALKKIRGKKQSGVREVFRVMHKRTLGFDSGEARIKARDMLAFVYGKVGTEKNMKLYIRYHVTLSLKIYLY